MGPRLVLICETPFTRRDEARFGLDVLEARGIFIEVWDVSEILLPKSRLQWYEAPQIKPRNIKSLSEFHSMVNSLNSHDYLLLSAGLDPTFWWTQPQTAEAFWGAISDTQCQVGALRIGSIPSTSRWSFRRVIRAHNWRQPSLSLSKVRRRLRVGNQDMNPAKGADMQGPPHLDFVWADTNVDALDPRLIGGATKVLYIHSLDYDQVLKVDTALRTEPIIAFIDCMGPSHPDYATHSVDYHLPMTSYRDKVCRALDKLEDKTGLTAVIAAHPRAQPGSLDEWYGGRKVLYQNTANLVARCSLVALADPSTAVGLAIAMQKPVLFFTSVTFELENRLYLKKFSRQLRAPLINIDKSPRIRLPSIHLEAYAKYMERYVKRQGTAEEPFWSVVADQVLGDLNEGNPS